MRPEAGWVGKKQEKSGCFFLLCFLGFLFVEFLFFVVFWFGLGWICLFVCFCLSVFFFFLGGGSLNQQWKQSDSLRILEKKLFQIIPTGPSWYSMALWYVFCMS